MFLSGTTWILIQSLADLGNSFEVLRGMRIAPVTKETILRLAAATLAPIVQLALTMMPLLSCRAMIR